MEQQNYLEEKELKNFYVENIFRNKYGLKSDLSTLLSNLLITFNEKFFDDFDYGKMKHIRNAQSNLSMCIPSGKNITKVVFYIGLMDKDDFLYKYSKQEAIEKVVKVLENSTIQDARGSYKRNEKNLLIDTLVVTKFLKEIDNNYIHYKVEELKSIFKQESIITEISTDNTISYNDETKEAIEYVENIMKEYNFDWETAYQAYKNGF